MEEFPVELIELLVHLGGAPTAIGFIIYYLWTHGPKKDFERLCRDLKDLNKETKNINHSLGDHERRLNRLELAAEYEARTGNIDRRGAEI